MKIIRLTFVDEYDLKNFVQWYFSQISASTELLCTVYILMFITKCIRLNVFWLSQEVEKMAFLSIYDLIAGFSFVTPRELEFYYFKYEAHTCSHPEIPSQTGVPLSFLFSQFHVENIYLTDNTYLPVIEVLDGS